MMMALVLLGLGVTAVGLQIVSRVVQKYSLDARRPDPLIEVTGSKRYAARPPELERLTGIVADSLSSDRIARSHLGPLLESLEADAPRPIRSGEDGREGRLRKRYYLDRRLDELEAAWGVRDGVDGATEPGPATDRD